MNSNKFKISYKISHDYWADIPPTIDGVLGGFGFLTNVDLDGSKAFMDNLFALENPPEKNFAVDCGAGIGRITKNLLINYFNTIDIVEPDEKFINSIKEYVGEDNNHKVGELYQVGLQEFKPTKKYDIIWNQWVLGYLTDEDLVNYLIRCREALSENGLIVIKENVTSSGKTEKDNIDSSITRSLKQYLNIFKRAGLKRIKQCKQTNFPNGIYPVYMFAFTPLLNKKTEVAKDNDGSKNIFEAKDCGT